MIKNKLEIVSNYQYIKVNIIKIFFRLAFARNKMGQILRAGQSSYQPKPVQSKVPQASYLNLNKQVCY